MNIIYRCVFDWPTLILETFKTHFVRVAPARTKIRIKKFNVLGTQKVDQRNFSI